MINTNKQVAKRVNFFFALCLVHCDRTRSSGHWL